MMKTAWKRFIALENEGWNRSSTFPRLRHPLLSMEGESVEGNLARAHVRSPIGMFLEPPRYCARDVS